MYRTPIAARLGVLTLLAAVALTGVSGPAAAAEEPAPDLSVSFDQEPVAEINNLGDTIGTYLYNNGDAPATEVTVTFDVTGLNDQVEASVPDFAEDCELADGVVTCAYGALQAGETSHVFPLELASKQGATPGAAGEVVVTIASAEADKAPEDNTTRFPVTVVASGPDLVAVVEDVNDEDDPVGPGETRPLFTAVVNEGDTETPAVRLNLSAPTGAVFVERYEDCTYKSHYPNEEPDGYAYGPSDVSCVLEIPLAPGEALLLFDEESGDSAFNLRFGKNLVGPDELSGSMEVGVAEADAAARRPGRGPGKTLADRVEALRAKADQARARAALEELDTSDNWADFSIFTKPNKLDVSVTAKAVTGSVGQTVSVAYAVTNNGPSDGSGPGVVITAPSGTVLLPAEWCHTDGTDGEQRPESAKLRCFVESFFPAAASGFGTFRATVRVKIKSTPGANGTIVARGDGPATESNPANNTARIVINPPGGSGAGEGLPITGAPTGTLAALGASLVGLGAMLYAVSRRRRPAATTP